MIAADLRLDELDPTGWANLLRSLFPPPGGDPTSDPLAWGPLAALGRATADERRSTTALSPRMPALVLFRGETVLRILQLGGGTLPAASLPSPGAVDLRAFRRQLGLPYVVALDVEALPGLLAEAQAQVKVGEDYLAQELAALRVLREALGRSVRVDPGLLGRVPLPAASLLQTTFNYVLPDERSVVFYLVENGTVWTSLIATKRGGDIDRVTSHAAISDRVRFASIRADAPAVIQAVAERFAPPHIGIFLTRRTWHELVAGDRSAVARALAARQAVLDPAPSWLLALVGAGAMAEAATRSVRLAGQLLSKSPLGSFLAGAMGMKDRPLVPPGLADRIVQTVSNPFEALGLDPWDFLRWSRDWVRRLALDRSAFAPPG